MDSSQLCTAFNTRKTSRRVTFAEGTKTTVGRSSHQYYRSGPNYEPGAFAASEGYKTRDTSFLSNNHFDIEQLTVYISSAKEVDWVARDYEAPPQNEGIVQHHPRRGEIMDLLEMACTADEEDFESKLSGADWLLLVEEGSSLTGGKFFKSWDAEDFDTSIDPDVLELDDPDARISEGENSEADGTDTDSWED